MAKLTIGDLDKVVRVGDVMQMLDTYAKDLMNSTAGLIEHWTDDEGLHWMPFQRDLENAASDLANESLADLATRKGEDR